MKIIKQEKFCIVTLLVNTLSSEFPFIENIIKEQESENSQVTSINEESKKIKISQKVKFVEKESKIKEALKSVKRISFFLNQFCYV